MEHKKVQKIITWLDKTSFLTIFLVWAGFIVLFGLFFGLIQTQSTYLMSSITEERLFTLGDGMYFSFITATSTGFGDIVPFGFFRVLSVIEVVFGLILFAVVTSKLIALKQNLILTEIYEHSLNDKANQIRTNLIRFRQNINNTITKVEKKQMSEREIQDSYLHFSAFEETLKGLLYLLKRKDTSFTKKLDHLTLEIITLSISNSLQRVEEFGKACHSQKVKIPDELTQKSFPRIFKTTTSILTFINNRKDLETTTYEDITQAKNQLEKAKSTLIKTSK